MIIIEGGWRGTHVVHCRSPEDQGEGGTDVRARRRERGVGVEREGRREGMFDIACLNEQPSNKLRLHTLCHGGKLQGSSRGITHEQPTGMYE